MLRTLLAVVVFAGLFQAAHASEFEIQIPPIMMSDIPYEGMITLERPSTKSIAINLASNSSELLLPENITIPPGKNHSIFRMIPSSTDTAEVLVHGITFEHSTFAQTTIYSHSDAASTIRISAPAQDGELVTDQEVVPMRVIITDNHGRPVPTFEETTVTISSSTDIGFSQSITDTEGIKGDPLPVLHIQIPAGEYYARFNAHIPGEGIIYALSNGMKSDQINVKRASVDAEIKIRILPVPAAAGSTGYFTVWFEKSGKIFIPDGVVDINLISSNPDHVRFGASDKEGIHWTASEDGHAVGMAMFGVQTKPDEPVTVTAIADGFVSGSTKVAVAERFQPEERDSVFYMYPCAWVVPDSPSDKGWVVVGMYAQDEPDDPQCAEEASDVGSSGAGEDDLSDSDGTNDSNDIRDDSDENGDDQSDSDDSNGTNDANGANNERDDSDEDKEHSIRPAGVFNGRLTDMATLLNQVDITASGGIILNMFDHIKVPNSVTAVAIPFELFLHEEHTINAIVDGAISKPVEFTSGPVYGLSNVATITPIPANISEHSDIAYLYVIDDSTGSIVDTTPVDIRDSAVVIQAGDSMERIEIDKFWTGGVTTISGMYTDGTATLQPLISGTKSTPTIFHVSGTPTGIDVWMPSDFYVGSEFPVAIHAMDTNDIPMSLIPITAVKFNDDRFSTRMVDGVSRVTAPFEGDGTMSVITPGGFIGHVEYTSSTNESASQVAISRETPDIMRLGTDILLDIMTGSMPDPQITFDGDVEFVEVSPGKYAANPVVPGEYSTDITITSDGWDPHTESFAWTVQNMVDVSFVAISDDGVSLPISVTLDADGIGRDIRNGDQASFLAGVYTIIMPQSYSFSYDRNYSLESIKINYDELPLAESFSHLINNGAVISTTYHRAISVNFDAILDSDDIMGEISGNGDYRYGETVRLAAEPVPELYGLVWHIPEEWNGIPDDAVSAGEYATWEALDSAEGYVEYSKNYTVLIGVILAGTAAPITLIRLRSPDAFLNLKDVFTGLGSKVKPKKRPKERKAGGGQAPAIAEPVVPPDTSPKADPVPPANKPPDPDTVAVPKKEPKRGILSRIRGLLPR